MNSKGLSLFKRSGLLICSSILLILVAPAVRAQDSPNIPAADRIRIAEAFKLGDAVTEKIWRGWSKAPFALLLITPDYEFLMRHSKPSADFNLIGHDTDLRSDIYFRKRVFQTDFLATFPAVGGVPTIVAGGGGGRGAQSDPT